MPRIDILEKDLTRATGTIGTDIPYIPGYSYDITGKGFADGPVLCTSVAQFEKLFGTKPVLFKNGDVEAGVPNNSLDRSYIMAKELLTAGMPVYYHAIMWFTETDSANFSCADFYTKLTNLLVAEDGQDFPVFNLADKGEYTIKYITTGGYPNYGSDDFQDLAEVITKIACNRGDCVALIEGKDTYSSFNPKAGSFYADINAETNTVTDTFGVDVNGNDFGSFAAAFTPWASYNTYKKYDASGKVIADIRMPACFGYLLNLANNIKSSPNWLAMAGTTRGLVPNIVELDKLGNQKLNNVIANAYQPVNKDEGNRALNAITEIKPYGLTIWGNRTLKAIGDELVATNFLNTRNMISDIKKVAYRVAKSLIYEQKNELLWINFKSQVAPYLEQLKSGAGIADYKLLKLDTHYNGDKLTREEFACAIKIYPVYAVESFEITVVVSDADVAVE